MCRLSLLFSIIILLQGCTFALTLVNSEGTASDVVDENQSPTNDVKPDLHIQGIPT